MCFDFAQLQLRHCEERSDVAIPTPFGTDRGGPKTMPPAKSGGRRKENIMTRPYRV